MKNEKLFEGIFSQPQISSLGYLNNLKRILSVKYDTYFRISRGGAPLLIVQAAKVNFSVGYMLSSRRFRLFGYDKQNVPLGLIKNLKSVDSVAAFIAGYCSK